MARRPGPSLKALLLLQRFNSKSTFCFVGLRRNLYYIIFYSILLYIILEYINYPPTPLAAAGARQRRNYQQQGPRSHYKQLGQEARKQERRSKKQLQATSGKKQETRSQEATSGWKTGQRASFLVDSESNVRQAAAPFVMRLLAAGRQLRQLVFLSVQKAALGTGGRGPQARSVLQGPAVLLWRRRRL